MWPIFLIKPLTWHACDAILLTLSKELRYINSQKEQDVILFEIRKYVPRQL
jgi:hypothetical protein